MAQAIPWLNDEWLNVVVWYGANDDVI
ncbi:hypothetical protein Tco_1338039, partial [Tanacetum coccineum]